MSLTERAFEELYSQTRQALTRHVRGKRRHAVDEDDVVQEAFYHLWRVDIGNPSTTEARRYLYGVANHLVIDRWRREGRQKRRWRREATQHWSEPVWNDDVTKALAQLAHIDRDLLWLAHVEGHSHADIAQALELPRVSIRGMLFRARARLRERLNTFRAGQEA